MKYMFFLILFTLIISGCGQDNSKAKADCMIEASKAPTKEGVEWGVAACALKYNK